MLVKIYNVSSLSDILKSRENRGNASILLWCNGFNQNDISVIKDFAKESLVLERFSQVCLDEVNRLKSKIVNIDAIVGSVEISSTDISKTLGNIGISDVEVNSKYTSGILEYIKGLGNVVGGIRQNLYIKVITSLATDLKGVWHKNRVVYVGKIGKTDITVLSILALCGVDVVVIPTNSVKKTTGVDYYKEYNGGTISVDIKELSTNNTNNNSNKFMQSMNDSVGISNIQSTESITSFSVCDAPQVNNIEGITSLLRLIQGRQIYRFNVFGVGNTSAYNKSVWELYKACGKDVMVLDSKPLSVTPSEFDAVCSKIRGKSIIEIVSRFGFDGVELESVFNRLLLNSSNSKIEYYKAILYMKLEQGISKNTVIISFGKIPTRTELLLNLLECLPCTVIKLNNREHEKGYNNFKLGEYENIQFPYEYKGMVSTNAFEAQEEIKGILYNNGVEGLQSDMVRNKVIPLKTTYDELKLYWNEQAMFRPFYSNDNSVVSVPTLFVKLNGVDNAYDKDILLFNNGIVYKDTHIPLVNINADRELSYYVRNIVGINELYFNKIENKSWYPYTFMSKDKFEFLKGKIEELCFSDWCNQNIKNLRYTVTEVALRLPLNILQAICSFDFSKEIPKIVVYSGDEGMCDVESVIFLMLMHTIGFDVLVIAPNGYKVIEHLVRNDLFNTINLEKCVFDRKEMVVRKKLFGIF